jgi:hypothetical protein
MEEAAVQWQVEKAAAHQLEKLTICSFVCFNRRYNHTFYLDLSLPYFCLNGTVQRLGKCCFNTKLQIN